MKRTNLATAVIAGIVGVAGISNMANAVFLNQDGLGQVLVYPYYTVNGGNSTLLSVVNTTSAGKAVKVRFLEAYDSREVLDFNLYMSPFDVWVAQVVPVGPGAGVFTNDNSCTVPALPRTAATAQPFSNAAFDGELNVGLGFSTDQGPTDLSRTLEGYVELIEMGEVTNGPVTIGATTLPAQKTLASITHSNGVPKDCTQVNNAWSGGYWATPPAINEQTDLTSPTGGLFGSGSIINVNRGGIAGYNAVAIDQFYSLGTAPQHSFPTDLFPSISSGTSTTSYVFENGQLATSTFATTFAPGVDAVSSLFMADQVYNEYVVSPSIGASTEWVVNFPTKRFYVDPNYVGSGPIARKPFDQVFGSPYTANLHGGGVSCSPVALKVWNREEASPGGTTGFSPAPVHGNALCYETQVITFGQSGGTTPSTILGSHLALNIPVTPYTTGWARITLTGTNHVLASDTNNTFYGLPVTGFSVTNYVNGTLTDSAGKNVQSNYTALYNHKFHRSCGNPAPGTTCS